MTFIYYKEVKLDAIEHDYFLSIANRIGMDLNEALLDPYFYFKLKLDKYQTYEALNGTTPWYTKTTLNWILPVRKF